MDDSRCREGEGEGHSVDDSRSREGEGEGESGSFRSPPRSDEQHAGDAPSLCVRRSSCSSSRSKEI